MKQLIVMIAMVILGIAIGALIMGFSSTAESIKDKTDQKIEQSLDDWLSGGSYSTDPVTV